MSEHDPSLTYSDYLSLDELLNAQRPKSGEGDAEPEHDELLFILIHQVYELWFKQLLHEIDYVAQNLQRNELNLALHTIKRIRAIFKVIVGQLDVLETMTPLQFNSFRDRLDKASGLQSYQFRELEFSLGLKDASVLDRYEPNSNIYRRLESRLNALTLWDHVLRYFANRGYDIPAHILNRDISSSNPSDAAVQSVLIQIYQNDSELTPLCEALTDVDEGLQEWRYRHVKMVQRTIGTKMGTGGTDGVDYLRQTLSLTLFPDLWAVRAKL